MGFVDADEAGVERSAVPELDDDLALEVAGLGEHPAVRAHDGAEGDVLVVTVLVLTLDAHGARAGPRHHVPEGGQKGGIGS